MDLFTSTDLAGMAKKARTERKLTQEEVAEIVLKRTDTKTCSKQAISQAENRKIGSRLDGLRIKIVEALTERKLIGPVWYFQNE